MPKAEPDPAIVKLFTQLPADVQKATLDQLASWYDFVTNKDSGKRFKEIVMSEIDMHRRKLSKKN